MEPSNRTCQARRLRQLRPSKKAKLRQVWRLSSPAGRRGRRGPDHLGVVPALGFHKVAKSTMLTGNKARASHVIASGGVRLRLLVAVRARACQTPAARRGSPRPARTRRSRRRRCTRRTRRTASPSAPSASSSTTPPPRTPRRSPAAPKTASRRRARSCAPSATLVAEVLLYGDCSLRFVSGAALADGSLAFLSGYEAVAPVGLEGKPDTRTFGIASIDHVVGASPTSSPPSTTSAA